MGWSLASLHPITIPRPYGLLQHQRGCLNVVHPSLAGQDHPTSVLFHQATASMLQAKPKLQPHQQAYVLQAHEFHCQLLGWDPHASALTKIQHVQIFTMDL
jgi:hypothetical protein